MSMQAIRAALETRLNAISPALATAWENVPYTPIESTPYQRAFLLPAQPEDLEMSSVMHRQLGIFQVSLYYPLHQGPGAALARAALILAAFKRKTTFTSGGVTVTVSDTPEIGPGSYDPDRYVVPVRIRWFSNIST